MSESILNFGVLGTGNIAKAFAEGLAGSKRGRAIAVGSRSRESAEAFGREHGIERCHGRYEDLLADDAVEAVYVCTPHPLHAEWAIKAAEAGKHVLCEKPIALNQHQAGAIVEAARSHGVALMEAFMYRAHPQTRRIRELIHEGAIGEPRHVEAAFGFRVGWNPESRLLDPELGGGGILDVGCYPASFARLVMGAGRGERFADPEEVHAAGHVGETGVDEHAAALLRFAGDRTAQIAAAVRLGHENAARIFGTEGRIDVPSPWFCGGKTGEPCTLTLHRAGGDPETLTVESGGPLFAHEADALAEAIAAGDRETDAMPWADSLGNMDTLDRWRRAIGVTYPQETPRPSRVTLANRPVEPREGHRMRYGQVPGVSKPVSKLVYGALAAGAGGDFAKAQVLYDQWIESGGNALDTGHIYGKSDETLGKWQASRGIRDRIVIAAKGAHTPNCYPEAMRRELAESLERLQTEHVEIYMLHRDNLEVPVGEFVDALNEAADQGRVEAFGGSNWSLERVEAFNQYAEKHGKRPMTVISNNLSLAEMIDPVWPGCVHVSDRESRKWLERHQIANFAWSSQARGFFTERGDPEKGPEAEIMRCWGSDANFERRRRAMELAEQKGVRPINIAAAYVLCQPFPTFALIGPETPTEMATSLDALDVELTRDEIEWLYG